jgi:hypothetical protein
MEIAADGVSIFHLFNGLYVGFDGRFYGLNCMGFSKL